MELLVPLGLLMIAASIFARVLKGVREADDEEARLAVMRHQARLSEHPTAKIMNWAPDEQRRGMM